MKKNNIVIVLVAFLALFGCKDKMRDLNTNKDLISDTQVKYMFTGALNSWLLMGADAEPGQLHVLMQYFSHYASEVDGNIRSYRNPKSDNDIAVRWCNSMYDQLFGGQGYKIYSIINYIDTQIPEEDQPKYADVRAICEGLLAYMQYHVLETFEATVYHEAFRAISEGKAKPVYEYHENLWKEIDETLAASVNQLGSPVATNVYTLDENDYFTGWESQKKDGLRGVVISKRIDWNVQRAQWLKFFNMARLENAWKLEGQIGSSEFDRIFNEVKAVPNGYFKDYDDSFFYYSTVGTGNSDASIYVSAQYCVSQNFVNLLIKNDDPRLPLLARPNGATELTSSVFAMMKQEFPDSLAKYDFLDGKHPYLGLHANPHAKQDLINNNPDGFISHGVIDFNKLKNPNYPNAFTFVWDDGYDLDTIMFCPANEPTFNVSLLIGSEVAYRYFLVCAGKNNANHNYSGNGIKGLGEAYRYELQADGCATNETGDPGQDLHLRRAEFSYPRQCFLLSMIGKEFAGMNKEQWYEAGMRSSLYMLQDEAHRMAVQAYTGGDTHNIDRRYPKELTQVFPSGDVTYKYPYSYDQSQIDAYVAKHPYSKENLLDQFYIYCYNDPYVIWSYWQKTGLPEFKEHANRKSADAEEHIYLEQPYSGSEKMTMIRRNVLRDKNTLNENFAVAKEYLQNNPNNPNYGSWLETDGKPWWQDCAAYPTGWAGIK